MLSEELKSNTERINIEFGAMNSTQLSWKPAEDQWSIAQCLQHLTIMNKKYLAIFENVAAGRNKPTMWERINPLTSYTGKQMIKSLGPVIVKEYKTPKLFAPAKNETADVIGVFKKQQEEMMRLFILLEEKSFSKVVITSPVANLITLKLPDAMKLIVVHEQRHIEQAIRVKNNAAFPR